MEDKKLLNLFSEDLAPFCREILEKIWIPPQEMEGKIWDKIEDFPQICEDYKVKVSGETENISLYLIGEENVLVYTPFMSFEKNVILSEVSPQILLAKDENLCVVQKDRELVERLELPKVILVNPWLKEVVPNPQLNLSVASLASYLRKYQKADVKILDMQLGIGIDDIVEEVKSFSPDILGISLRFGYFKLCSEILESLRLSNDKKPLIIAGGSVAALDDELLRRFPDILICNGEGERAMVDLAEYVRSKRDLSEVSGIRYLQNGEIKSNSVVEIEMDDLPVPAMDTVEGLAKIEGAMLSMETSRGCSYNACTFCTRRNMPRKWKGMSPSRALRQMEYYRRIFDNFDIEPTIYLTDEDFIGRMSDGKEAQRITEIMQGITQNGFKVYFYSIDARVDQIYNSRQSKEWHIERMKMLHSLRKAISSFFLLGVESGSTSVLKRFNKKITPNETIMALRILSSLGIDLRAAFINFDPLMNLRELKENIMLLERNDVFLRPVDLSNRSFSELFDNVHDEEYVASNSLGKPLYEKTGFMTTDLEVLMGSRYADLIRKAERDYGKKLLCEPDHDKAICQASFLDDTISDIALAYRKWFEKNWTLDGTLRGLMYTTSGDVGKRYRELRRKYKEISFLFLKSLAWLFDRENMLNMDSIADRRLIQLKEKEGLSDRKELIAEVMGIFDGKMYSLVDEIKGLMDEGMISESDDLKRAVKDWEMKRYSLAQTR